jgi:CBS domain-containing protein
MTATAAAMMNPRVATVDETAMMGMVEGQMAMQNVRHVAVVDAERRLVGVVSRGDVLRARGKGEHELVRDHMTRRVFTVRPDVPATHAIKIMMDYDVGCVPVVDADTRPVGILVETDFLEVARQALLVMDAARR